MKTINKIAFSKLSNAYHVSFLFAINQLIKEFKQKAYPNGTFVDDEEDEELENTEGAESVNVNNTDQADQSES